MFSSGKNKQANEENLFMWNAFTSCKQEGAPSP